MITIAYNKARKKYGISVSTKNGPRVLGFAEEAGQLTPFADLIFDFENDHLVMDHEKADLLDDVQDLIKFQHSCGIL